MRLAKATMNNSLQFMDCSRCGKRVRTTAKRCHHCQQDFQTREIDGEHEDEDFDYEQFIAEEFPEQPQLRPASVKFWVWVTAWILILATLLPFFYYFLN